MFRRCQIHINNLERDQPYIILFGPQNTRIGAVDFCELNVPK